MSPLAGPRFWADYGQTFNNPTVPALAGNLAGLHWKRHRAASCSFKMISFSNINKQYGKQLLFVDASFQLHPGEKVGLVGPNGAENRGQEGVKKSTRGLRRAIAKSTNVRTLQV